MGTQPYKLQVGRIGFSIKENEVRTDVTVTFTGAGAAHGVVFVLLRHRFVVDE